MNEWMDILSIVLVAYVCFQLSLKVDSIIANFIVYVVTTI